MSVVHVECLICGLLLQVCGVFDSWAFVTVFVECLICGLLLQVLWIA